MSAWTAAVTILLNLGNGISLSLELTVDTRLIPVGDLDTDEYTGNDTHELDGDPGPFLAANGMNVDNSRPKKEWTPYWGPFDMARTAMVASQIPSASGSGRIALPSTRKAEHAERAGE
jgi:hypothetical protein